MKTSGLWKAVLLVLIVAVLSGSWAPVSLSHVSSSPGATTTAPANTATSSWPQPCPLFGDFPSCNCVVDVEDIMQVASRWRCREGDGCYEAIYDLDGDGDTDIVDIMLVVARWGDIGLPDLSASTNSVSAEAAERADTLTYTIVMSNTGECDAEGVVTNTVPSEVTLVPGSIVVTRGTSLATRPMATSAGGGIQILIVWSGTIAVGEPVTMAFQATVNDDVPKGTAITDTARIDDGKGGILTREATTTVLGKRDLSTSTKSVNPATVDAGDVLTYTIVLSNTGDADAVGATVTDTVPASTTYVPGSAWASSGTIVDTGGLISWTGTVTQSSSVTTTFQVTITPELSSGTSIVNTAEIDDDKGNIHDRSITRVPRTDTYEPNSTFVHAYGSIAWGQSYKSYIWTVEDKDYFKFDVNSLDPFAVDLQSVPPEADYDLKLYDPSQNLVASSTISATGGSEHIDHTPTTPGTHYLLVESAQASSRQTLYSLTIGRFGSISGNVVHSDTGQPIDGANVGIAGTLTTAATNGNGFYTIQNAPVGVQTIVASKEGYSDATRQVTILGAMNDMNTMFLPPLNPSTSIDPSGGTVEATNSEGQETSISVPPGAVTDTVDIAVTPLEGLEIPGALPEGQLPLSVTDFHISEETIFAQPATITMPLPITMPVGTQIPIYEYNRTTEAWESTGITGTVSTDEISVSAEVSHLSTYSVMVSGVITEEGQTELVISEETYPPDTASVTASWQPSMTITHMTGNISSAFVVDMFERHEGLNFSDPTTTTLLLTVPQTVTVATLAGFPQDMSLEYATYASDTTLAAHPVDYSLSGGWAKWCPVVKKVIVTVSEIITLKGKVPGWARVIKYITVLVVVWVPCPEPHPGGGNASAPPIVTPTDSTMALISANGDSLQSSDGVTTVTFPTGSVSGPTIAIYMPQAKEISVSGFSPVRFFTLEAYRQSDWQKITKFNKPIRIQVSYAAPDVAGLNESKLELYYFDTTANQWVGLPSTVDTENKTVTASSVNHFSLYGLMAPASPSPPPTNPFPVFLGMALLVIIAGMAVGIRRRKRRN